MNDVVVFEGFDELDALGPDELLENAADAGGHARVDLVTLDGTIEALRTPASSPSTHEWTTRATS